jgi:hypothetical protein
MAQAWSIRVLHTLAIVRFAHIFFPLMTQLGREKNKNNPWQEGCILPLSLFETQESSQEWTPFLEVLGFELRDFTIARQVLYYLNHSTSLRKWSLVNFQTSFVFCNNVLCFVCVCVCFEQRCHQCLHSTVPDVTKHHFMFRTIWNWPSFSTIQ